MTVHPDIPHAGATSVTHFVCPSGPTKDTVTASTHHLVPRRAGTQAGEPVWEQTCSYCGKTEKQLREELAGGLR